MSQNPRILVTSAAGRTGTVAVLELLGKGFPVRAFVRRKDARSETLREAGAEIFVGNLFDFGDLRTALVDVQRAYHCPPFAPNLLHGTMLFALAAEEAKLEVVALMSGWNPHPIHPALATREHWIANNVEGARRSPHAALAQECRRPLTCTEDARMIGDLRSATALRFRAKSNWPA